jgi:hypothetical protein
MTNIHAPFWGGLVLGLLIGAGLVLAGPSLLEWRAHWRAPTVVLRPEVTVQASILRLKNLDGFQWEAVQLVLNGRTQDEGYTVHLTHLPAGAQRELSLASFITEAKLPFDPRTTKAYFLRIRADTPRGRGEWAGRLDEAPSR